MIVTFEKEFLQNLYENGKATDMKHWYQPQIVKILKSATLLKSQSVAAQTAKNAIFLVRTDFLPCVG